MRFGHSPWSWAWRLRISSAARRPISQALRVGADARIDGVEIAPGRQNVESAARRRARRPGRNEASAKGAQQPEQLRGAASSHPLAHRAARRRIEIESDGEAVSALRRSAEHMQAVADTHVLEVAEPGVEGDERLVRRLVVGGAFLEQTGLAPSLEDQRRNGARPARIERLRLGEFVEQPLELERCAMRPGGDQRRRQMADRDRADAAFGLRRFAGIVDDERINDWRRAEQHFGRASSRSARPPCRAAIPACHARRAERSRRLSPCARARNGKRHRRGAAAG